MVIAIDFDRTLVEPTPYDATTKLRLSAGAHEALLSLKRAGHILVLWSARANLALREDPMLDPLVRAGARRLNRRRWEIEQPIHQDRYEQMLAFVAKELPGVFAAIDDGRCGKIDADLFIDDRAARFGSGLAFRNWFEVQKLYGLPVLGSALRRVQNG